MQGRKHSTRDMITLCILCYLSLGCDTMQGVRSDIHRWTKPATVTRPDHSPVEIKKRNDAINAASTYDPIVIGNSVGHVW